MPNWHIKPTTHAHIPIVEVLHRVWGHCCTPSTNGKNTSRNWWCRPICRAILAVIARLLVVALALVSLSSHWLIRLCWLICGWWDCWWRTDSVCYGWGYICHRWRSVRLLVRWWTLCCLRWGCNVALLSTCHVRHLLMGCHQGGSARRYLRTECCQLIVGGLHICVMGQVDVCERFGDRFDTVVASICGVCCAMVWITCNASRLETEFICFLKV